MIWIDDRSRAAGLVYRRNALLADDGGESASVVDSGSRVIAIAEGK